MPLEWRREWFRLRFIWRQDLIDKINTAINANDTDITTSNANENENSEESGSGVNSGKMELCNDDNDNEQSDKIKSNDVNVVPLITIPDVNDVIDEVMRPLFDDPERIYVSYSTFGTVKYANITIRIHTVQDNQQQFSCVYVYTGIGKIIGYYR